MQVTISARHLIKMKACPEQLDLFWETFGGEISFHSKEDIVRLFKQYADVFSLEWFAHRTLGSKLVVDDGKPIIT